MSMKKLLQKYVDIHLWKDFYDERWRMKVTLFGHEIARFRIDHYDYVTFQGHKTKYKVERVSI